MGEINSKFATTLHDKLRYHVSPSSRDFSTFGKRFLAYYLESTVFLKIELTLFLPRNPKFSVFKNLFSPLKPVFYKLTCNRNVNTKCSWVMT